MEKWDRRFLELAKQVSTWSKDPSTQVGAVLTRDRNVVGMGFNGLPRGVRDTEERLFNRTLKYQYIVHAEVNSCLDAGRDAQGATLYLTASKNFGSILPCAECTKVVIQSGVKEIVGYDPLTVLPYDSDIVARWAESFKISEQMLKEAGVTWRDIPYRKS